jgi:medium-chain acyl-[acyl-carrier-protein] hydrolase
MSLSYHEPTHPAGFSCAMLLNPTMQNGWITTPLPRPRAAYRLFVLPYAGGGVSHYRAWTKTLAESIELCLVHLPGREQRLFETPIRQVPPMAEAFANAVTPWLDRPYAFFGHSMGALISFETSRILRRRGQRLPVHLFASAHRAPHLPDSDPPVYHLPDADFIAKLRTLNGTPQEVLDNAELMELLMPLLRADFELSETYTYTEAPRLNIPMTAIGGTEDHRVPPEDIEAWGEHTTAPFTFVMVPGDHFFVHDAVRNGVVNLINQTLLPI